MIDTNEYAISGEVFNAVVDRLRGGKSLDDLADGKNFSSSLVSQISNGNRELKEWVLEELAESLDLSPFGLVKKLLAEEKKRIRQEKSLLFDRGSHIHAEQFYQLLGDRLAGWNYDRLYVMCGGCAGPKEVEWMSRDFEFIDKLIEFIVNGGGVTYFYPHVPDDEKCPEEGNAKLINNLFGLDKRFRNWKRELTSLGFSVDTAKQLQVRSIHYSQFPFYGPGNYYLLDQEGLAPWGALASLEDTRYPFETVKTANRFCRISEKESRRLLGAVQKM